MLLSPLRPKWLMPPPYSDEKLPQTSLYETSYPRAPVKMPTAPARLVPPLLRIRLWETLTPSRLLSPTSGVPSRMAPAYAPALLRIRLLVMLRYRVEANATIPPPWLGFVGVLLPPPTCCPLPTWLMFGT